MKYIIIILFSLGLILPAQAQKKNKERDLITTTVEGLGCPFCAYGLEKKFKKVKGIKKIKIDIEEGIFSFTVPTTNAMTLEEVDERVTLAGYTAIDVRIDRADGMVEESRFELQDIATDKTREFAVFGICDMCKSRIERNTQKIKGVGFANWDKKTKILKVKFDSELTNVENIKEILNKAGHDTEDSKASDDAYDNLPACCAYDRDNLTETSH